MHELLTVLLSELQKICFMWKFKFLTVVLMKVQVLWDIMPCYLVNICRSTWCHIPEDWNCNGTFFFVINSNIGYEL